MRTFLWLWLFFGARLMGQDYALIKADGVYLYENGTYVVPVRIDSSIQENGVLKLYNLPTIRSNDTAQCTNLRAPNWLGKYILVEPNGDYVFFNWENDSIRIKTNTNINETWTCMSLANGQQLTAYVSDWDTLSFLGITDSVKRIEFQAVDMNGAMVNHSLNAYHLKISKNYGTLSLPGFFRFENNSPAYSGTGIEEDEVPSMYVLNGTPTLGKQPLTIQDIYNYDIGDEIHRLETASNGGAYFTIREREKIMDKITYGLDSVSYLIDKSYFSRSVYPYPYPPNEVVSRDTIWQKIRFNNYIPVKLPYEVLSNNNGLYRMPMQSTYNRRILVSAIYCLDEISDLTCVLPCFEASVGGVDTLIEGLGRVGRTTYYDWGNYTTSTNQNTIVYYKKGNEEWGVPFTEDELTSLELISPSKIALYPNPATDWAYIHFEDARYAGRELRIQVRDMQGKEVISPATLQSSATYMLRTSDLAAGIYSVEVREGEEILWAEKLVLAR